MKIRTLYPLRIVLFFMVLSFGIACGDGGSPSGEAILESPIDSPDGSVSTPTEPIAESEGEAEETMTVTEPDTSSLESTQTTADVEVTASADTSEETAEVTGSVEVGDSTEPSDVSETGEVTAEVSGTCLLEVNEDGSYQIVLESEEGEQLVFSSRNKSFARFDNQGQIRVENQISVSTNQRLNVWYDSDGNGPVRIVFCGESQENSSGPTILIDGTMCENSESEEPCSWKWIKTEIETETETDIDAETETDTDTETEIDTTECHPTGCSGQICADEDVITTCEWRPEYECYRDAECTRQNNGECGWTETDSLQECLAKALPECG